MGMFSFNQNAGETSETIARKRQIAQAMMQQGTDTSAIQHPLQGVARIAQALSGNWANSRLDRAEKGLKDEAEGKRKAASDSFSKVVASLMGGQPQTPPAGNVAQPGMAPMAPGGDTFQKMIQVESGGNPNAVSPKGATGIAQVMPATARDPGFGVPNIFDFAKKQGVQVADNSDATLQALLRNPQVNAGFGEAYFNAQKQRYGGDERLAAAAYNAGPGAVDKAGGVPNIPETQDYVRKLGLNGGQPPQVQPAGYQQPQPAAVQQAGGGDMSALLGLLSDPNLNEQQQGVLASILKQRMTPADPMQALEMQKLQLELYKMQNPGKKPPIEVGGRLVDPDTYKPVYEPPPEPEKPPADVQEYQFYLDAEKAAGRQPVDFWTFQKGKVPNTTVNVGGSPGDDELRKKLQGKEGESWAAFQDSAAVSGGTAQDMQILDELITLAPQGPISGRLAEAFPGVSSAGDAFQSVIKRVAPTLRAPGSGSTSDIEYDGMLKSLPALRNNPEANVMISQIMKAKAAINMERGDIVSAYSNGQITAAQAREKMAQINKRSIMTPEMKKALLGLGAGNSENDGGWSIEEVQ